MTVSSEVQWRYSLTAFFQCGAAGSYNADFFTAGKPESWGKAYQKVYGEEIILPRYIAEEYTIPTPIKENDVFVGWYDNAAGTGTALTVLPVGWKGTVYAIWESVLTDVDNIYPKLDVDAPMYDLLGRQVGQDYRGIVIQNGRKYIK
jgi:uncharacterized repeat protein (TIGR02543 family)